MTTIMLPSEPILKGLPEKKSMSSRIFIYRLVISKIISSFFLIKAVDGAKVATECRNVSTLPAAAAAAAAWAGGDTSKQLTGPHWPFTNVPRRIIVLANRKRRG
jgi:hypothetical protein